MKRFFDTETESFITEDGLRAVWENELTPDERADFISFPHYVDACLDKNGTLIPVPSAEEMDEDLFLELETGAIVNRNQRDYILIHDHAFDEYTPVSEIWYFFAEIPRD